MVAGTGHSLAVTDSGRVWAWGDNADGEIGDGTTVTRLSPVPVTGLSGLLRGGGRVRGERRPAPLSAAPAASPLALRAGWSVRTSRAVPAPLPQAGLAIAAARAELGKPYLWGGVGPDAFDCSGLMLWSWGLAGVRLPRVAADQQAWAVPVAAGQVRPGDLIFYGDPAYHVTMYLGNGLMIEAPFTGAQVRIEPVAAGVAGYGRVWR